MKIGFGHMLQLNGNERKTHKSCLKSNANGSAFGPKGYLD